MIIKKEKVGDKTVYTLDGFYAINLIFVVCIILSNID